MQADPVPEDPPTALDEEDDDDDALGGGESAAAKKKKVRAWNRLFVLLTGSSGHALAVPSTPTTCLPVGYFGTPFRAHLCFGRPCRQMPFAYSPYHLRTHTMQKKKKKAGGGGGEGAAASACLSARARLSSNAR